MAPSAQDRTEGKLADRQRQCSGSSDSKKSHVYARAHENRGESPAESLAVEPNGNHGTIWSQETFVCRRPRRRTSNYARIAKMGVFPGATCLRSAVARAITLRSAQTGHAEQQNDGFVPNSA